MSLLRHWRMYVKRLRFSDTAPHSFLIHSAATVTQFTHLLFKREKIVDIAVRWRPKLLNLIHLKVNFFKIDTLIYSDVMHTHTHREHKRLDSARYYCNVLFILFLWFILMAFWISYSNNSSRFPHIFRTFHVITSFSPCARCVRIMNFM